MERIRAPVSAECVARVAVPVSPGEWELEVNPEGDHHLAVDAVAIGAGVEPRRIGGNRFLVCCGQRRVLAQHGSVEFDLLARPTYGFKARMCRTPASPGRLVK